MKVSTLERRTLSKQIIIDGDYNTRCGRNGFVLAHDNAVFVDELQMTGAPDSVLGELIIRISGDGESEFDIQRKQLGLNVYPVSEGVSRVGLAYARFVVVKGYSALPQTLAVRRASLSDFVSTFGLCPDPTESMLLDEVLHLDVETSDDDYNLDGTEMLLIVDKVFVCDCARRCGISEYIHSNLADLAHVFIGVRPHLVILNCGDFSNEHTRLGVSETSYKNTLKKHYSRVGYKSLGSISPYVMWKLL